MNPIISRNKYDLEMERSQFGCICTQFSPLLLSFVLCLAGASSAFSQGSISFLNTVAFSTEDPTGGNRLVYDLASPVDPVIGVKLAGTNWVAELYAGTDVTSLAPLTASISKFRNTTSFNKGKWSVTSLNGGFNDSLKLPYSIGSTVTLMVKVWDYNKFPTFEQAVAAQGTAGASAPFTYVIPEEGTPPVAYYMEGLQAFALGVAACLPHAAQATAQLGDGGVAGITVTDHGCNYTNVPFVSIKGGGGSGATATAVVSNTQVVAVNVTSPGCCYSQAPSVVIYPPWFKPTVNLSTTRIKVAQHVVLGLQYQLEASFDTINWSPTGPPFIADDDVVEREFDVGTVGGFFRVRELQ